MQCTRVLQARAGFFSRSVKQATRTARIIVNMETLSVPQHPYHLISFNQADRKEELKLMCDSQQGGYSKAELTWHPETATEPFHMRFKGSISTELPRNRPDIQRSGYAAFRTQDPGMSLFGEWYWDVDQYKYLAMKIKSDGRKYHINIQTDSIVHTDIHQHRLYAQTPGEWETAVVDFNDFVRTNHGLPVEPQSEIMKNKLKTVGIGLIDRISGPFDVSIAEIYATNDPNGQSVATGTEAAERERLAAKAREKAEEENKEEKIMI